MRWETTTCHGCGEKYGYNAASPRVTLESLDCKECQRVLRIAEEFGDTETGQQLLFAEHPDVVAHLEKRKKHQAEFVAQIKEAMEKKEHEDALKIVPEVDITPLWKAGEILSSDDREKYQAVISIGFDGEDHPDGWLKFEGEKKRLRIQDWRVPAHFIRGEGGTPGLGRDGWCQPEQLKELLEFIPRVTGRLLVHCYAGHSRSTAATLIFYAFRMGVGKEKEAVEKLFEHSKNISPNPWMVALADCVMERKGNLFEAAAVYDKWVDYPEVMQTIDYARVYYKRHQGLTAF
jgi:hypothetical protein